MGSILEAVKTLNSVARTLLIGGAIGGLGLAGWAGYSSLHARSIAIRQKEEQIVSFRSEIEALSSDLALKREALEEQSRKMDELRQSIREREADIERLDLALRLITVDRRMARLTVVDQRHDSSSGIVRTWLEFVELDDAGQPIDVPRQFELQGDVVFVDAWVVKFDDPYVRQADLHRGTSLVLFRRLFGEYQKPLAGFVLDEVGSRPGAYGTGEVPELEKQIWAQFWSIANDPDEAAKLGIRAAHGEAPSIRLEPGMSYLLQLRASDGLSIVVDRSNPPPPSPAS